jgi:hypothetical protein
VGTERTTLSHIFNKTSGVITSVENVTLPAVIEGFVFKQETNQYG